MIGNNNHKPKKILAMGVVLVSFLICMSLGATLMSNAVYCYATGNWTPVIEIGAGFGVSYVVVGASLSGVTSAAGGCAVLAAMLGPVGWLAVGGIIGAL
ncbi:MAG: hypothetical protein LBI79_06020 [Nitrososphaerota archaeon]|jgi:hypothetical protein|nr:hypothetical protein [Nitrososphaerota archaeon]